VNDALQFGCSQRKTFGCFLVFVGEFDSEDDDGDDDEDGDTERRASSLLSELLSSALSLSLNPEFTGDDAVPGECVRWCDTSADLATKVDVQPGNVHLKGLSPVCVR